MRSLRLMAGHGDYIMKLFDFEIMIAETAARKAMEPDEAPIAGQHFLLAQGAQGADAAPVTLDLDRPENQARLQAVKDIASDEAAREAAGRNLFDLIFQGKVRTLWDSTLGAMQQHPGSKLRLRLWFRDGRLADLPWELLHDGTQFLAKTAAITLCRYIAGPEPTFPDTVPKLKVLVVIARPTNHSHLDEITDDKVAEFLWTFKDIRFEPKVLKNPTLEALQGEIANEYHVLHFLGHGAPNTLLLTTEDGSPRPVPTSQLQVMVAGRSHLRLVILNACASGTLVRNGRVVGDATDGVGPGLVQAGVPAVVAMQYDRVTLDTALLFNKRFYEHMLQGRPVDVAATEARIALTTQANDPAGWSTPVLYLGTRSGRVVELSDGESKPKDDLQKLLQSAEESRAGREVAERLVAEFRRLGGLVRGLEESLRSSNAVLSLRQQIQALVVHRGPVGVMMTPGAFEQVAAFWQALEVPLASILDTAGPDGVPLAAATVKLQTALNDMSMTVVPARLAEWLRAWDSYERYLADRGSKAVRTLADGVTTTLGRYSYTEGDVA